VPVAAAYRMAVANDFRLGDQVHDYSELMDIIASALSGSVIESRVQLREALPFTDDAFATVTPAAQLLLMQKAAEVLERVVDEEHAARGECQFTQISECLYYLNAFVVAQHQWYLSKGFEMIVGSADELSALPVEVSSYLRGPTGGFQGATQLASATANVLQRVTLVGSVAWHAGMIERADRPIDHQVNMVAHIGVAAVNLLAISSLLLRAVPLVQWRAIHDGLARLRHFSSSIPAGVLSHPFLQPVAKAIDVSGLVGFCLANNCAQIGIALHTRDAGSAQIGSSLQEAQQLVADGAAYPVRDGSLDVASLSNFVVPLSVSRDWPTSLAQVEHLLADTVAGKLGEVEYGYSVEASTWLLRFPTGDLLIRNAFSPPPEQVDAAHVRTILHAPDPTGVRTSIIDQFGSKLSLLASAGTQAEDISRQSDALKGLLGTLAVGGASTYASQELISAFQPALSQTQAGLVAFLVPTLASTLYRCAPRW
jgi:hypothetical protein